MAQPAGEIKLKGINASPGICIGKAYLVDREGVDIVEKYKIDKKNQSKEIKRFRAAVKKAADDLRRVIKNSPEELRRAQILETHVALLTDKMLYGKVISMIEKEGVNAEWALKQVVASLRVGIPEHGRPLPQGARFGHRTCVRQHYAQPDGS